MDSGLTFLGSLPRCGSTYLLRSLMGKGQGEYAPEGGQRLDNGTLFAQARIIKTHRRPAPGDVGPHDRALFLFGDPALAVQSTVEHRLDPNHFANCGADWPPQGDIRDMDILRYTMIWDMWRRAPFPVLFVRYDALKDCATRRTVEEHLGRRVSWLPWRPRCTKLTQLERMRIEHTYTRLVAEVRGSPDVFMVGATEEVPA